jgi:hypothetical protein
VYIEFDLYQVSFVSEHLFNIKKFKKNEQYKNKETNIVHHYHVLDHTHVNEYLLSVIVFRKQNIRIKQILFFKNFTFEVPLFQFVMVLMIIEIVYHH